MRKLFFSVLVVAGVLGSVTSAGWAQVSSPHQGTDVKRESACHLEFSINELEDGKKINVRHYAMNLTGGVYKEIKVGSRIPVEAEQGKFQYLDVGISIEAKIYGKEDAPILDAKAEVSSIAGDQGAHGGQPIVRQMVISGNTLLVYDKLMTIGAADDPSSKRQYQLDVTATKIR